MILHATHPAPVLRVPHGRRNERLDLERTSTAVEVTEVSPSEVEAANPVLLGGVQERAGAVPVLHGGKLFRPMSSDGRDTSALDLASVLEGRPMTGSGDPRWHQWMAFHMRGSPLFAPFRDVMRHGMARADYRGDVLSPHRSVRRHAGEAASQAMRDYARDDLLLVGGVPHVRVVPLASARRDVSRIEVTFRHRAGVGDLEELPCAPDGLDAVLDAMPPGLERGGHLATEAYRAWSDLPATVFGDRAAVLAANNAPYLLRVEREQWLGDVPVAGWPDSGMVEAYALAGLVSGEAVGDAIRTCAAQARALLATGDRRIALGKVPGALRVFEEAYLPAYAPDDDLGEDAEAFATLGP